MYKPYVLIYFSEKANSWKYGLDKDENFYGWDSIEKAKEDLAAINYRNINGQKLNIAFITEDEYKNVTKAMTGKDNRDEIDREVEDWFVVEYGSDYRPTKEEFEQVKKEYMEYWRRN